MNHKIAKKLSYWTARPDADMEHAMEFVANINNVDYVNDSKSITIKSTFDSINSIDSEIVLIIGGPDKNSNYAHLLNADIEKIKAFIYLGIDNKRILELFGKHSMLFAPSNSIEEAVQTAHAFAVSTQVVLFSPACVSDNPVNTYKERGEIFKNCVKKLDLI